VCVAEEATAALRSMLSVAPSRSRARASLRSGFSGRVVSSGPLRRPPANRSRIPHTRRHARSCTRTMPVRARHLAQPANAVVHGARARRARRRTTTSHAARAPILSQTYLAGIIRTTRRVRMRYSGCWRTGGGGGPGENSGFNLASWPPKLAFRVARARRRSPRAPVGRLRTGAHAHLRFFTRATRCARFQGLNRRFRG
jgi:hypothetical protein